MGPCKYSTSGMVDVKHCISWKVNSQTANTYDEDLVSFIKERGALSHALQQVTVGLQCIKLFSLLTQKGTDLQQNYSLLDNMCFSIYLILCHFLSFGLFRIKPLELNYKEYDNNMNVICYHILHTFSTMHYKH